MVGRDQELALLLERWSQATSVEGQAVLLVGEAGIGKSRITRATFDAVAGEPHIRIRYQCSPYHTDSAFWPVIQQLTRAAGLSDQDTGEEKLDKLEAPLAQAGDTATAPLIADLMALDGSGRYGALELSPQAQRTRTLRALCDQLVGLARRRPVLLVLEDVHWIDPTTFELIELALDRVASAQILILMTSRPENQPQLAAHPQVTRLTLNRLGRVGVEAIVERLSSGTVLPLEVIDTIIARTDGVPLFVEELTKAVLESHNTSVPASLHDSLMSRLDRLPDVKELAQTAACIGREFEFGLLVAISGRPKDELVGALDKLAIAELVFRRGTPPDAHYTFKHALVRDAAYASLLRETRRGVHQRIADQLDRAGDHDGSRDKAVIGRHRESAGELVKALLNYRIAGDEALQRSANTEAMAHFSAALRCLDRLPNGREQAALKLELLLALGRATFAAKSYAAEEAGNVFRRARELCDQDTDREQLLQVLTGEFLLQLNRANHLIADKIAEKIVQLGESRDFNDALIAGLRGRSTCALWLGQIAKARAILERLLKLCRNQDLSSQGIKYGYDPHLNAHAYSSVAFIASGFLEQAAKSARLAVHHAGKSKHLHSVAIVHCLMALAAWMGRRTEQQLEWSCRARQLADQQGFQYVGAIATIIEATALVAAGMDPASVRPRAERALAIYDSTESRLLRPAYLTMLSEIVLADQDQEQAQRYLEEALTLAEHLQERFHIPEIHRRMAQLALNRDDQDTAETSMNEALKWSRLIEAPLFELRAARDLARLWAEQGERQKAYDLLFPVYDWFTEGFDTPDLIEAKELLENLG